MKKLSIVVPVYNVERYIKECVNSLIEQKYKNIEIILVDDGSTDNGGKICDELAKEYSCINVIHQENQGLPGAKNTGLKNAVGEYIAFIDSDDLVHPNMFEALIYELEKTNSDIAICNYEVFNKKARYPSDRYNNRIIEFSDKDSLEFYKCSMDSSCNRVYKKNIIINNNIWFVSKNIVSQEDYYFQMKLFTHINRIVTISNAYYLYRERKSSITKSGQDEQFAKRCLDFAKLTTEYITKNSKRDVTEFLNYQYANMLLVSINNVKYNTIKNIKIVIEAFLKNKKITISKKTRNNLFPNNNLQAKYYKTIMILLNMKCYFMVSMFEKLRIKKLRSATVTDYYYE